MNYFLITHLLAAILDYTTWSAPAMVPEALEIETPHGFEHRKNIGWKKTPR